MTAGTIFSLLLAALKVANYLLGLHEKKQAMDEAKRLVLADQLVGLAKQGKVLQDVEAKIAGMSDAAVVDELSKRGDFRD